MTWTLESLQIAEFRHLSRSKRVLLNAQQRYFSYRAMLVAIVSQNSLVLVFMGYRTIIARYVAKWGYRTNAPVTLSTKGGYHTVWGSANLLLKLPCSMAYRSDSIAVARDIWEKLNRGVSKPGCFPLFSGKVQIVS